MHNIEQANCKYGNLRNKKKLADCIYYLLSLNLFGSEIKKEQDWW